MCILLMWKSTKATVLHSLFSIRHNGENVLKITVKPGLGFLTPYVGYFQWFKVGGDCLVDIDGIVDHHCLNLIKSATSISMQG